MDTVIAALVRCLDYRKLGNTALIPWSSPIPCFGDLTNSRVASLGLNPSNREFVDAAGRELDGDARRFHTLNSLGLATWADANARHLRSIIDLCFAYFRKNPYDQWFRKLEYLISSTGASYYKSRAQACHLDLIPYATALKWTTLTREQRASLSIGAGNTLALLLRDSPVRLLILNGNSVVTHFEAMAGIKLRKRAIQDWSLNRKGGTPVAGMASSGSIRSFSSVSFDRDIFVLGFNHNIQSSFGISTAVMTAIRQWIGREGNEALA